MDPKPTAGRRPYHRAEGCEPAHGDRVFHANEFDFDTAGEDADNQAVFEAFLAKAKAARRRP